MPKAIARARRAALCARVGDVLTPELLTGRWRNALAETGNRYAGHCYAAAEALFHMVGGRAKGWLPCVMSNSTWQEGLDPGETHWFIRHERTGEILDPTAGQFDLPVPYDQVERLRLPDERSVAPCEGDHGKARDGVVFKDDSSTPFRMNGMILETDRPCPFR